MFVELCIALTAHWVADFVFQSDRVGKNKSKSVYILTEHVAVYTAVLMVLCLPIAFIHDMSVIGYSAFIAVNCVTHWLVDRITSTLRAKVYNPDNAHKFFVLVGLDQLIHTLILIGSLFFILGV